MDGSKGTDGEACSCPSASSAVRPGRLTLALRLEYLTVAWNVIEGIIAVTAALLSGSVALLGFGIDSFVECASALVMIWRLRAERSSRLTTATLDTIENRARRLVAASLFLLAAYVTVDALETLATADRPAVSYVGAAVLLVSIAAMLWLARAKRRVAQDLGSHALEADAFQTTACWWLSVAALIGLGLNGILGWWWADPVAALVIAALIVREGTSAWKGHGCVC